MRVKLWARNELYDTGVRAGTPTKVDIGKANYANGFVPGKLGAQTLNALLHDISLPAKRSADMWCSSLRNNILEGDSLTGTGLAVVYASDALLDLAAVGDKTKSISDLGHVHTSGSITSHTVGGLARNNTTGRTMAAMKSGTNKAYFSDNDMATWTAATVSPAWNPTQVWSLSASNHWFVNDPGGTARISYTQNNGANWTTYSTNGATNRGTFGVASTGAMLACDGSAVESANYLTPGTWTVQQSVPAGNSTSAWLEGLDLGSGLGLGILVARYGNEIRAYTDPTGTWDLRGVLPIPAEITDTITDVKVYSARPQNTLFLVATTASLLYVWRSDDLGRSWHDQYIKLPTTAEFAASNGRLWVRVVTSHFYSSIPGLTVTV